MGKTITFESQLTRWGFIKIQLKLYIRHWACWLGVIAGLYLILLGLLSPWGIVLLPIVLGILIPMAYPVYSSFYACLKQNRNMYVNERFTFQDEGVQVKSEISNETLKWNAFIKQVRVSGYYLLYRYSIGFFAISKSAVPPEDVADFEALLDAHIPKK